MMLKQNLITIGQYNEQQITLITKALQMEREQMINSYHEGYSLAISGEHPKQYDPELYYSQTFKK